MSQEIDTLRSTMIDFVTGLLRMIEDQEQRLGQYGMKSSRLEVDNERLREQYAAAERRYDELLRQYALLEKRIETLEMSQ